MSPAGRERGGGGPEIGQALKDARRRIGMEIKEAEERTKIRARYLRALEAEDWEALPAPAYVRGFLRTYGQLLGLDGELLADQFRRRHEEPAAPANAAAEPLLQNRRRPPGSRPPSRASLIAAVLVAIVALLVLLGLLGDGDGGEDPGTGTPAGMGKKQGRDGRNEGKAKGDGGLERVDVSVEPLASIQVCLVGGSNDALLDSQVLSEGDLEEFGGQRRYRLDLASGGDVRFVVGEESERLSSEEAASFEGDSEGIRAIDYAGPDCP